MADSDDLFEAREGTAFLVFEMNGKLPAERVHELILGCSAIVRWWNYFPGFYILETDESFETLETQLKEVISVRFLVASVEGQFSGRLPFSEWKYFLRLPPEAVRSLEASVYRSVAGPEKNV